MVKKYLREDTFISGTNHWLEVKNSGRRSSDETVGRVRALFLCSPQKSSRRASRELGDVPHVTVWEMLCKRMSFRLKKCSTVAGVKVQ
jgi:hypothetical protein